MRILTVTTTFPRHRTDTIPRFVLDLCTQMVEHGHQVRVVTPHSPGAARSEEIDGVEVRRFRYMWPESAQTLSGQALHVAMGKSWFARLKAFPFVGMMLCGVQAEIFRFRPDLIHCHWLIPQGTFCAAIGKLNRIPVLVSLHGGDVFNYRNRTIDAIRRWTMKNVKLTVANSSAVSRRVNEIQTKQDDVETLPIIPMGVDTQLFSPTRHADSVRSDLQAGAGPLLLAVGRLSPEKGHRYLLEALPAVLNRFPEAVLAVAGYGPCEADLKQQARDLGIEHSVRWLGPKRREELAPIYASADLFVSPSIKTAGGWEEALGLVFLEAMASGTVPVGTRTGGIADVIRHGVNGVLAEEKDPADLAQQILWVLENPERRKVMSAAAVHTADKYFSWNSVGVRYNKIYSQACVAKAQ